MPEVVESCRYAFVLSWCTSFLESVVENSLYSRLNIHRSPVDFVISKSMVFRNVIVDIIVGSFVFSRSRA